MIDTKNPNWDLGKKCGGCIQFVPLGEITVKGKEVTVGFCPCRDGSLEARIKKLREETNMVPNDPDLYRWETHTICEMYEELP